MKVKKILLSAIALIGIVFILSSCEIFGTESGGTGGDGNNSTGNNNDPKFTSLIYSGDDIDLSGVRAEMIDVLGYGITVNHISNAPVSRSEVVFGDSDRAITAAAKSALSSALEKSKSSDTGYIIYTDGVSIAVYWLHPDMQNLAINDFINVCVKEKQLVLDLGTVYTSLYEKREFDLEKDWLNLATVAGDEVVEALKRLKSNYDSDKLIGWMANLYDPAIGGDESMGGFYYSISARDNEPFLPDLESTSFILGNVTAHGAIKYDDIPDDIKLKILSFVWDTQSRDDGYFYHKQWPQGKENLNTDRYGRDLSWATSIIKNLKIDTDGDGVLEQQYPLYCAPNGDKCAAHVNTEKSCSFPVTTSYYSSAFTSGITTALSTTASSAVSRMADSYVAPVAAVSQHPVYTSATAFSEWLEAYNATIKDDSGHAHQLAALRAEITAQGFSGIVLDHLDRVQREIFEEQTKNGETPSGLWQREANYEGVWGLLKYTPYYNDAKHGRAINPEYAVYIAQSCVKVILTPVDNDLQINDIYNMWTGVSNLVSNVRSKNVGTLSSTEITEKLEEIYAVFRENATALIESSIAKIAPFKIDDGSYAYNSDGTTQPKIYGTPVCLGGKEGDVNSVHLCCNMYQSIFRAFGFTEIPLYTAEDGERFISILRGCELIVKKPQDSGSIDYEDAAYASKVTSRLYSSGAQVTTVEDPENSLNNVLYFASTATTGKDSDYLTFLPSGSGTGCYIFETKLYILQDSDDVCLYQISLGEACMIALTKSGTDVTVTVDPDAHSSKGDDTVSTKISVDTWTKLRIECYIPEEGTGVTQPKIKIWIDDELVLVSDKYIGYNAGTPVKVGFTGVKLYALRGANTYIYMDDTFISKEDKEFDAYDESISDSRDG